MRILDDTGTVAAKPRRLPDGRSLLHLSPRPDAFYVAPIPGSPAASLAGLSLEITNQPPFSARGYYLEITAATNVAVNVDLPFTLEMTSSIGSQPELILTLNANGAVAVRLEGSPARLYRLEVSANLKDWSPFYTGSSEDGTIEVNDPAAASVPTRFYRAVQVP